MVVLGCSGTYPGPDRACSSYLVEAEGSRLLVDCGNGSLSHLQRRCDVGDLDGVVLTHLHHDHIADVIGMYYALRLHPQGPKQVAIHAPAGTLEHLGQMLDDVELFARHCRFSAAAAGDVVEVGPFRVSLFASAHPVETLAPRIEVDGRVLGYSADSGPTPALRDVARDADLFVADATWLERQKPLPPDLHMTGREAGLQAAEAGAARLLVTHLFPTTDPGEVAAEAAEVFDGEVLVASDLMEIPL